MTYRHRARSKGLLEKRNAGFGRAAVCTNAVETGDSERGRYLGMLGHEALVARIVDAQLDREALGVREQQGLFSALSLDIGPLQTGLPEIERLADATRKMTRCTMPLPARPRGDPGYSKNVMSEPALPRLSA